MTNATTSAPPLSAETYARSFQAYLSATHERQAILAWMQKSLVPDFLGSKDVKILSVGCGTGAIDFPLLDGLSSGKVRIEHVGLEPNPVHREAFASGFAAKGLRLGESHLLATRFEDYRPDRTFDLVLFSHSLYYIADLERNLAKALSWLRPTGRVVIIHETPKGSYQLRNRFLVELPQPAGLMMTSREIGQVLDGLEARYRIDVLQNWIDVTACFDPQSRDG
jgi:SAM-dependent methyltransferase